MSIGAVLVLILLGGWALGRCFAAIRLPSVVGMLVWGVLLGTLLRDRVPAAMDELAPFLTTLALVVILLRAGLGLRRSTLNRVGATALKMAVIPCLLEGAALTLLIRWALGFPWAVAGLSAFLLAAVSPAVVVPAMLRLKDQGYGHRNDVPTVVLAGASVDDVLAITLFSLFLGLSTGEPAVGRALLHLPVALALGLVPGLAAGRLLAAYFRRRYRDVRATEKALVLLMVSVLLVQVGHVLHTAALLGIMAIGFVLLERAEHVAHELAGKLSRIWVFAEIVLFVLIGMAVDPRLALQSGPRVLAILVAGLLFRSVGVFVATARSPLTGRERLFCALAYLPKATVQAALGSVPLAAGLVEGPAILAMAVLAIAFTAPVGLLAIRFGGARLLDMALEV